MKYQTILFVTILVISACTGFAQESESVDEPIRKFKPERVFLGTGVNVSVANHSFKIGLNPEAGYSITNWLDAGIALNLNYFSQNATTLSSIRYRDLNYGAGVFLRAWPVNFLHIQVQPEYNWVRSSQKDVVSGQTGIHNYSAESLLVGVGYGSRMVGQSYTFVTLMIDVLQNINSPYRDQYNDPLPVFRAGIGIYLKPQNRY